MNRPKHWWWALPFVRDDMGWTRRMHRKNVREFETRKKAQIQARQRERAL